MSNERPYRLALLGTPPSRTGEAACRKPKASPAAAGEVSRASVTEGAPWTISVFIVRNAHEQRAPLSPRVARHPPVSDGGKLNAVDQSLPGRSGGGVTR